MAAIPSKGIVGSDARLRKDKHGAAQQRGDPMAAQAATQVDDGTVTTREERMQMIRNEWQQNLLPIPPEIPGYHTCWLSTTNSNDTVHRRLKMGYQLVRRDEIPVGFDLEKGVQSGSEQYADYVTCNEMLLSKIPSEKYQDAMALFHHYQPREEESAIRARVKNQTEELNQEAGVGVVRTVGGGFDALGVSKDKEPPPFSD